MKRTELCKAHTAAVQCLAYNTKHAQLATTAGRAARLWSMDNNCKVFLDI